MSVEMTTFSARPAGVLSLVADLLRRLSADGIGYCHWKSNWILEKTLAGGTDLDLLVERRDADAFRSILHEHGFRQSIAPGVAPFPSVEHYHALDHEAGRLVHVHAYYRVISGDSLAKNFRLPIEAMLLENLDREGIVAVPTPGAELVVFVLRMSLKHASFLELLLLARDRDKARDEAAWLSSADAREEAIDLVAKWLPGLDVDVFAGALDALVSPASVVRRLVRSRRLRAQLRTFARRGRVGASLVGARVFAKAAVGRLRGSRTRLAPAGGGAVIAFVGAEATGKSTLIAAVEEWLGAHYTVRRVHAGKPPSSALTTVPNMFLPALRAVAPRQRSTRVSMDRNLGRVVGGGQFPLLFGIRSVLLAYDRRRILRRAYARSANGEIVLCDRYPSVERGATDGRQLDGAPGAGIRGRLAALEARLYDDIPPPDLVIRLTAPLDITLERNRARAKSEPDEYVRSRHARASRAEFERVPVVTVDTNRPLDELTGEIRRVIWEAL